MQIERKAKNKKMCVIVRVPSAQEEQTFSEHCQEKKKGKEVEGTKKQRKLARLNPCGRHDQEA